MRRGQPTVADAMLSRPTVHRASVAADELREFLADDHVHMALLVDDGRLVGVVERDGAAPLEGRTASPDLPLAEAQARLRRSGRRRLAVVDGEGTLLGLLCLKASGHGFCSDEDVTSRKLDPCSGSG